MTAHLGWIMKNIFGIAIQAKGKFFITYRSCISLESAHSETLWGKRKKKKSKACLDFGHINERGLYALLSCQVFQVGNIRVTMQLCRVSSRGECVILFLSKAISLTMLLLLEVARFLISLKFKKLNKAAFTKINR